MLHKFVAAKQIAKILGAVVMVSMLALALVAAVPNPPTWLVSGQSRTNWRSQPLETTISPANVGNLQSTWAASGGDVSATPSVSDGIVYYPDWAGNVYAKNAGTGALVWTVSLSSYLGAADGVTGLAVSRTTPAIAGNTLLVAAQNRGWLLALNRGTGALLWKTQLDAHIAASLTQSPVVFNNVVYEGVSSQEEGFAADPTYPCCSFRGSFLALNLKTGQILWKTYTAPAGYSGNAVWGSTAAIDPSRKLVYIDTGNNYTVPADVASGAQPLAPNDYVDSILALDLMTGQVVWADQHLGLPNDTWTVACFTSFPGSNNCPPNAGPDYDFGQGPMLVSRQANGKSQDLVVAGQKSGSLWALDAVTGQVVWEFKSGVGSTLGGLEWGSATDGTRVYYANAAGGFWGAVDIATGQELWRTSDPNFPGPPFFTRDIGAVSVANGVVYAGSLSSGPGMNPADKTMFALNAATGQILWSFASGSSVGSGPAIVDGTVYWGTGYARIGVGSATTTHNFYAFRLK